MNKILPILLPAIICQLMFSQTTTYTMSYGGYTRDYIVYKPAGYNSSQTYPLVFNLHGYSSNATQQMQYSQMNNVADTGRFIVVYPNGVANAWNVGFGAGTPYGSGINDVGFLSKITDTLQQQLSIDPKRIYSCGMSNGGYLSHRLACEMPGTFAAVASVTGSMTDSTAFYCNPARAVPVLQIHGTTDPVVNYNGLTQSYAIERLLDLWRTKDNCTATRDTIAIQNTSLTDNSTAQLIRNNTCGGGSKVYFFKVTGGGHTWPGGAIDIPTNGNTNRDFNASQEIWKFFRQFSLPTANGIEDIVQISTALYPNPSNNTITIECNETIAAVNIYNITGSLAYASAGNRAKTEIDISHFPAGLYIAQIRTAEGHIVTKRFEKE
jgi:polyhydroxybutyrate depolymerase